jgi:hypothetical protein
MMNALSRRTFMTTRPRAIPVKVEVKVKREEIRVAARVDWPKETIRLV